MKQEWQSGRELAISRPGIHAFRRDLVLAICRGTDMSRFTDSSKNIGHRVVAIADAIVEETEQ